MVCVVCVHSHARVDHVPFPHPLSVVSLSALEDGTSLVQTSNYPILTLINHFNFVFTLKPSKSASSAMDSTFELWRRARGPEVGGERERPRSAGDVFLSVFLHVLSDTGHIELWFDAYFR